MADWQRGSEVVWRSLVDGHVGAAIPTVLVEHSERHAALFQPAGTSMLIRTGRRGGPTGRVMYPGGWDGGHELVPWRGVGVLRVHRFGDPFSVWRWLDPDGWRPGCYVNIELPWRRSEHGFDSRDLILDVEVDADRHSRRKDTEELDWAEEAGAVSAELANRIRTAATIADLALRSGRWPFRADWQAWLPDPEWAVPQLPDGCLTPV